LTAGVMVIVTAGCTTSSSGSSSQGTGGQGSGTLSAEQAACVATAKKFIEQRGGDLPKTLPKELTPLSKPPKKGLRFTTMTVAADPTSNKGALDIIEAAQKIGWKAQNLMHN